MTHGNHSRWTDEDIRAFQLRGISTDQADRQIQLLRHPPSPASLVRPCTVEDGILRLTTEEQLAMESLGEQAILKGRVSKFVPASGAATRMFKELLAARETGDRASPSVTRFESNVESFAFYSRLEPFLTRGWDALSALLHPDGLDYAALPKALIEFHQYPAGSRTAFEEHLREGAALTKDSNSTCRLHFTVSPEHQRAFEELLESARTALEADLGVRLEVTFSSQDPSTDTLAIDADGNPFRGKDGALVFRPGGHGALLRNLNGLDADLVLIRNIDNITHERLWSEGLRWRKILIGLLISLEEQVRTWLGGLENGTATEEKAKDWAIRTFGTKGETGRDISAELNRPVRVCGVVRNTGEPGGGPFWVNRASRVDRQIVESAQIDLTNPQQRGIFSAATHFNPVDLVCSLRDFREGKFDLHGFVDESAVFVSQKSLEGRPLLALERPGLWNGCMADWISVFVEMPLDTFHPVKTVYDLLQPPHQPAR